MQYDDDDDDDDDDNDGDSDSDNKYIIGNKFCLLFIVMRANKNNLAPIKESMIIYSI